MNNEPTPSTALKVTRIILLHLIILIFIICTAGIYFVNLYKEAIDKSANEKQHILVQMFK